MPDALKDVTYKISRRQNWNFDDNIALDDEMPMFWHVTHMRKKIIEEFVQNDDESLFQGWRRFKIFF